MIDEDTAIVMCYTGWKEQTARNAIAQWRNTTPDWNAKYIKPFLSAQDLKRLERLTSEVNDE